MAKKESSGELPGMSDESIDLLKKANGGRPCKFVVACRASKPLLVLCAKKGEPTKLIKEIKGEITDAGTSLGGITFCSGVVKKNDEGVLAFQVAAGGDWKVGDAPVQDAAFGKYLKDQGLPPVDARVLVVATVDAVLDPSDPLVARFFKVRDVALQLATVQQDHATDLRGRVSQIERLLDADPASDVAYRQIEELESRVRALTLGGAESPQAPVEAPGGTKTAPPSPDSPLGKFQQRLSGLIKQAAPYLATVGTQLKTLATQARELAGQNKLDDATKLLLQIGELIKNAATAATSPNSGGMEQFKTRLTEVKKLLDEVKSRLGDGAKLLLSEVGAMLRQAAELAQRGDFAEALNSLELAAGKVGSAGEGPAGPADGSSSPESSASSESSPPETPKTQISSLVAYRQALLNFQTAKSIVAKQVETLRRALPAATGEASIADEMAELLDEYYTELGDAIDTALVTAEDEAEPVTDDIRSQIDLFLADLSENPLIKHLDANPYGVQVAIRQTLTAALTQIRAAMPV